MRLKRSTVALVSDSNSSHFCVTFLCSLSSKKCSEKFTLNSVCKDYQSYKISILSACQKIIYLLAVLGLCCCGGFSLAVASGDFSLVVVNRLLIAEASLVTFYLFLFICFFSCDFLKMKELIQSKCPGAKSGKWQNQAFHPVKSNPQCLCSFCHNRPPLQLKDMLWSAACARVLGSLSSLWVAQGPSF